MLSVLSPPLLDSATIIAAPAVEPEAAPEATPEIDDAASESGSMVARSDYTQPPYHHALAIYFHAPPSEEGGEHGPSQAQEGAARAAATDSSQELTADNLSA